MEIVLNHVTYCGKLIHQVWVLLAHIFRIATEHAYSTILELMHLIRAKYSLLKHARIREIPVLVLHHTYTRM